MAARELTAAAAADEQREHRQSAFRAWTGTPRALAGAGTVVVLAALLPWPGSTTPTR
jgi:hypothetical protein